MALTYYIGTVDSHGSVQSFAYDPDEKVAEHHDYRWNIPMSWRWRYGDGDIIWNNEPEEEQKYAVENHLARKGLPINSHETWAAESLQEGEFGCLMAGLTPEDALNIRDWATENICHDSLVGDGMEAYVHVTAFYGLDPDVTVEEIQEVIQEAKVTQLDILLGDVSRFDTDDAHDVLVVDVTSEDLERLNAALAERFGVQSQYDFNPHLTLAYVEKGSNPELDGHAGLRGNVYRLRSLTYSSPGGSCKTEIPLELSVAGPKLVMALSFP